LNDPLDDILPEAAPKRAKAINQWRTWAEAQKPQPTSAVFGEPEVALADEDNRRSLPVDKSLAFIMAGNATVTLVSKKTGTRFTYRVQAPHHEGKEGTNAIRDVSKDIRFVQVLTGQDNENSYRYLGYIKRGVYFHGGAKAKIGQDAPSAKAFAWAHKRLVQGADLEQLEIWHEGRCCRCARKLTVPESIASGIGPECATKGML
jgi:hypothetical protein